jgi:mannan endo-1,4-beta-mannosidase
LHEIYGNHILSGQEEDKNEDGADYILQTTGKYPAIRAFDVNNSRAAGQCVAHWGQGGSCMFGYHMGLIGGDGYQGSQTVTEVNQVITEGSALNQTFKARLDKTAVALQTVQDAAGVAILRLFHEAGNGCNWFWGEAILTASCVFGATRSTT